ncbi:MAG: hypothetical protein ACI835_004751 [Planctomycetota bacterium]|jgi:hypothetical protein
MRGRSVALAPPTVAQDHQDVQHQLRILLVDGTGTHAVVLSSLFSELNAEPWIGSTVARDPAEGAPWCLDLMEGASSSLSALESGNYQLALIAAPEAGQNALDFLRLAKLRAPEVPLFLISDSRSRKVDPLALNLGAAGCIDPRRIRPLALDRSLRFAYAQQCRVHALQAQYEELLWLHRMTDLALEVRDRTSFSIQVTDLIARRADMPLVWIESYEAERQEFVCRAVHGLPLTTIGETSPVRDSLACDVIHSGRPRLEMSMDSSMLRMHDQVVGTWICLPMIAEGRSLGVVTLAHTKACAIDSRELHGMATLVEHFAKLSQRIPASPAELWSSPLAPVAMTRS